MSSKQKLIERLKSKPKDFTWKELVSVCRGLGFNEIQGNGSRVKFHHPELNIVMCVHKPHPSNIVKEYVIKQFINTLEEKNLI